LETDCWNHQRDRKQSCNECHSATSGTQPTKHYWKKTQKL